MSEHALVQFPAAVPKSQQEAKPPLWKELTVGRTVYRVVPDEDAPNGHKWHALRGTNAFGQPDWQPTQPPARRDVEAALYAAS